MRFLSLSILAVILSTSIAAADRDRRRRDNRRPVVRDNRTTVIVRDNRRPVVVRDRRYVRPRYTGPVRANRRVIDRRPLYVNNGHFRFHNGRTVVYRRPVIATRYYDFRVRPQIIVENYPAQHGYIWVSGNWSWNGGEWIWNTGYYAPDPAFKVYYDDDSYDINIQAGYGYDDDGY